MALQVAQIEALVAEQVVQPAIVQFCKILLLLVVVFEVVFVTGAGVTGVVVAGPSDSPQAFVAPGQTVLLQAIPVAIAKALHDEV